MSNVNTTTSDEQRIEMIARVCHEANRAWCEAHGDTSQKVWDEAEQWQRDSAIEGVFAALGGAAPAQQHESWCEAKVRDGWTYGPVKDADAKTHPCLVDYALLPPWQKSKDALFVGVVESLTGPLGLA